MTTIASPPAAPTAAPPSLTPGGRSAWRAALVIAASVLTVGCVVALGMTAWGISAVRVVVDEKGLPGDMRALLIDTGELSATVRLTTDDDARQPRASMRLVDSSDGREHSLVVTTDRQGTRLAVAGSASGFGDWGRADEITVTLPSELARRLSVTVQQRDGDLVAESDVDTLVARTRDGNVALSGAARRMDLTVRDGNIRTRERISVSESFRANTVDGDVTVRFADAPPRTIDVDSRDGDITLSLPDAGPYLVEASAESPTIRVPQTDDATRAAARVAVRSVDGTVVVDQRGRR